uniref:NIN1 (RPN12) binding protein 1 homolog n=1 Tax=Seriola lalandi dorsalis TaxID=1841481 RepID=A0A3B4XE75_SERLL
LTNIYTLKEVVNEIRDKPTRRSLAFLPYQLHFKDPHPEHVRHVTEFSKKTGDYPSLSATDIKVLALTYQLELEQVGSQHLRRDPEVKVVNIQGTQRHPETPVNVAGFHFPSKKTKKRRNDFRCVLSSSQNVLIQIGLHVLSVNGMLIKQARNYILRCHACFKTTSNMNKVFCPHCGNKTLKKLAVTVSEDGSMKMHFSKNPKVLNPRGLRHSLPLPQGGKHGSNPQLVEDQRFPQQRLSQKARQKTDVFDPDYVAGASPFCQNDIYSRAANLQIRDGQCGGGRRRANPNATHKKFVKKK